MESRWRLAVVDDRRQGDILPGIVEMGHCGTCGTPVGLVVGVEGDRPIKIDEACPNEVCVLGDWVI